MAKQKYTRRQKELRAEYRKQRKRIEDAIRKLEKQGYIVPLDFRFDKLSDVDKITKKDVAEMKLIKPKTIRERSIKSEVVEIDYSDLYGDDYDVEGKNEMSYQSVNVQNYYRMYEDLMHYPTARGARWLLSWLESALSVYGVEALGQAAKELYYNEFTIKYKEIVSNEEYASAFANDMIVRTEQIIISQGLARPDPIERLKFRERYGHNAREEFDDIINEVEEE